MRLQTASINKYSHVTTQPKRNALTQHIGKQYSSAKKPKQTLITLEIIAATNKSSVTERLTNQQYTALKAPNAEFTNACKLCSPAIYSFKQPNPNHKICNFRNKHNVLPIQYRNNPNIKLIKLTYQPAPHAYRPPTVKTVTPLPSKVSKQNNKYCTNGSIKHHLPNYNFHNQNKLTIQYEVPPTTPLTINNFNVPASIKQQLKLQACQHIHHKSPHFREQHTYYKNYKYNLHSYVQNQHNLQQPQSHVNKFPQHSQLTLSHQNLASNKYKIYNS
eukprot:gene2531-1586_t